MSGIWTHNISGDSQIGTDHTGIWKSHYNSIKTTTTPFHNELHVYMYYLHLSLVQPLAQNRDSSMHGKSNPV